MFGAIKNTYKMSEAAVVVQNLLQISLRAGLGNPAADCAQMANNMVAIAWKDRPDLFSGKFGQRPHKISVAAAALAEGVKIKPLPGVILALGNLLTEVETNGRLYPLHSVDHVLIEEALKVFLSAAEEQRTPLDDEIDQMMNNSFSSENSGM
ncbi:hypothetical protein [Phyllobacterium bourgognense]|uniref:Uncharacterized protein n=1 Tax=Phyllobacterium bourgognense TaxID=314236 RepID=A0A368Z4R5_9HYPH|nr:hypothetical protein [Phyllobacterium bourgognense]RCW85444.1 hypothetical protein C7476_103287 [Phyllobacterium bourgognense]